MDFKIIIKCISFLVLFVSCDTYATSTAPIVCNETYALCTSAPCIPDPRNPKYAICSCDVEKGENVGFKACAQRQPTQDKYNATHLISTFSFNQFASKKSLTCQKGMPWSNCLDMPCVVDPQNHKHAICSCSLDNTQDFFTFGGDCKNKSCATGFWSGATQSPAIAGLRVALNKEYTDAHQNPPTPTNCSVPSA